MGMLATINTYRALSPQQRRLLKAKRIEGDYSPDYWLRLLDRLAEFDTDTDRLQTFAGIAFWALFVPVIIATVVTVNIYDPSDGLGILPLLLALGVILMAASGVLWLVTRRVDLSNHLRGAVMPLLALLGEDVKAGRTLRMKLDMRGSIVKDKFTEKLPAYAKGAYHKIVESLYEDPWLEWEAALADGSHLQLWMQDSVRSMKRTKRTARGKTKIKTKNKVKTRLEVRLKLPAARYRVRDLPTGRPSEFAVKVREGKEWKSVNVRLQVKAQPGDKWLVLHARETIAGTEVDEPRPEPVLDLMTRLYQGVETLPVAETSNV
jgi:hypothetical protein